MLTVPSLRVDGVDKSGGRDRAALQLREFGLPLTAATAPAYQWFSVANTSTRPLRVAVAAHVVAALADCVAFDIVGEATSARVGSVVLLPDTTITLGVRVAAGRRPLRRALAPATLLGTLILQPLYTSLADADSASEAGALVMAVDAAASSLLGDMLDSETSDATTIAVTPVAGAAAGGNAATSMTSSSSSIASSSSSSTNATTTRRAQTGFLF